MAPLHNKTNNLGNYISKQVKSIIELKEESGYLLLKLFATSFIIIVVAKLLLIVLNAMMARYLGASDYGLIAIIINLCQILVLFFTIGIPAAGVRFVASLNGQQEWGKLAGYFRFCLLTVLTGIVVTIIAVVVYLLLATGSNKFQISVWLIALLLPPTIIGMVRAPLQRGFNSIWGSLVPREILAPLMVIFSILFFEVQTALEMGMVYSSAYFCAEIIGLYILWRCIPTDVLDAYPEYELKKWLDISIPIQLQGIARMILQRSDLLFIGAILGLETAGIYAVAQRLALALVVVGRASSMAVSPLLAKAYHSGDPRLVEVYVRYALLATFGLALPVFMVIAVYSQPLIEALFGQGYENAAKILVILAIGQLANALFNPLNQALLMTEFERVQLKLISLTTVVGLMGYPFFTYYGGTIGTAVWTSILLVSVNLLSYIIGYAKLRDQISKTSPLN